MEPPCSTSPAPRRFRPPAPTPHQQQRAQRDWSSWTYASPDLNVLLSGQVIDGDKEDDKPTARFRLDRGRESVHIEHRSLVTIHSTPAEQVLVSVNTGKPILSIPVTPSSQPSTSRSTSSPEQEPLSTVTVHFPLVSRQQYDEQLVTSSFYSTIFRVLLDGPEFLPPHFDPEATPPSTPHPTLTPTTTRVTRSPTLQRALLSPLLSPQRTPHSQGSSDTSVPPLSLGVARARAPALPANSARTTASNLPNTTPSPATTTPVGLYAFTSQNSPLPLSTIHTNHVSQQAKQTAEEIVRLRKEQDAYAKRARLELDLLTARIEKASHETLFAKKSPATPAKSAPSTAASGTSPTTVQRGFPEAHGLERVQNGLTAASAERERSRDRLAREISEERGRSIRGPEAAKRDESISSRIRAEDEREQEERGRSTSRVRRGSRDESASANHHGGGDETSQTRRSESRSGKAVAEVVAAVKGTSTASLAAPMTNQDVSSASRSRSPYQAGDIISATLDDETHLGDDDTPDSITPSTSVTTTNSAPQPQPSTTASSTRRKSLEDGTTIDNFVPSVNALVAIPETEELALEEEENGRRGRDARAKEQPTSKEETSFSSDDEDEEEHDAPFEMDEDIDVEDLELGSPPTSTAPVPVSTSDVEPAVVTAAPASPQVTASISYRPSSFRPSTLSSSYAALLQTSMARQQQQQHSYQQQASFKSPPTSATNISSPPNASSSFRIPPLDLSSTVSGSPSDLSHATSTTAREDAQIAALLDSPRDQVDPQAMKQGEQKLRDVLAIDAPSHRSPLPRRGQRIVSSGSKSSRIGGGEESSDDEYTEGNGMTGHVPSRFAAGSLPISIGMGQPRRGGGLFNGEVGAGEGRDREGERELQRKTSVPVREGMFVPPFLPPKKKNAKNNSTTTINPSTATAVPFDLGPSKARSASTWNNATGSMTGAASGGGLLATSLARSIQAFSPSQKHEHGQSVKRNEASTELEFGRRGSIERTGITTDARNKVRITKDEEEDEEEEEGFVPPHEMVKVGRSDEELLSRSVDEY